MLNDEIIRATVLYVSNDVVLAEDDLSHQLVYIPTRRHHNDLLRSATPSAYQVQEKTKLHVYRYFYLLLNHLLRAHFLLTGLTKNISGIHAKNERTSKNARTRQQRLANKHTSFIDHRAFFHS